MPLPVGYTQNKHKMLSAKETQTVTAPRPRTFKKQPKIPTYGSSQTAATQEGRKDAATQMTLLERREGPSASLFVRVVPSQYSKEFLMNMLTQEQQAKMAYVRANGVLQKKVESYGYHLRRMTEEVENKDCFISMILHRLQHAQDTNVELLAHNAIMAGVLADLLGRGDVLDAEQQLLLAPILGAPRATLQRGGPAEAAGGSTSSSSMVIDAEGQEEDALATVPQKPHYDEEAVLPLVDPLVYALTQDAVRGAKKRTGSPGLQHSAHKKGKLQLP